MTIRITSIERTAFGGHYAWQLNIKGIRGEGVYGQVSTGTDGHGLYYNAFCEKPTELLPPARFYAHPGLTAEQVVHRVAACLVCVGWGEEDYDDREAITGGRAVRPIDRRADRLTS